jgi:hypothetical protein
MNSCWDEFSVGEASTHKRTAGGSGNSLEIVLLLRTTKRILENVPLRVVSGIM